MGFADVYDYWAIRRNGDFFCVKSIFEDTRSPSVIFFDTRIVRVTEALLYLLRLYDNLGVDRSSFARIAIRHSGLTGRSLTSSSFPIRMFGKAQEDSVEAQVEGSLSEIETQIVSFVRQLVSPLLELFDFYTVDDAEYDRIVERFVAGEVA